mmetsp:Transcript_46989/g.123821  ORF Transcript_46989/g.123821 Transcript_46989/m.123821 type:complete len:318 (-) Transcript_46989:1718-2671(-)
MLGVAAAPIDLEEQLPIGMERLERIDVIDHLLQELIVVPVAVLVLAKIEEAHARRAIERRAAAPLAKRVDGFKLSRGQREACAAELALCAGEMAASAIRLLAQTAQPLDVPLLCRVRVLLEDRLVLPLMMERTVALADAVAVAVLTAGLTVLRVIVVGIELVAVTVEMGLRLPRLLSIPSLPLYEVLQLAVDNAMAVDLAHIVLLRIIRLFICCCLSSHVSLQPVLQRSLQAGCFKPSGLADGPQLRHLHLLDPTHGQLWRRGWCGRCALWLLGACSLGGGFGGCLGICGGEGVLCRIGQGGRRCRWQACEAPGKAN